ncbi:site-2 protease family protein [archaeon]|nr:MAG: site-2 protease family protein [archaeon]
MAFGFSKIEIRDLAVSVFVLAFAFSSWNFSLLPLTLFIIVIAFAAHEIIGHKLIAQHFGYFAEYRMWPQGLVLALISSLFGFIFAAPGAVYISPVRKKFAFHVARITERENGIISLGGPAVNIVLGFALIASAFFIPALEGLFSTAARISFWLAIFNLIPFPPLDGSKVLAWSKPLWVLAAIAAAVGFLI